MADLTGDAIAVNFRKPFGSQSDAGKEIVVAVTKSGGGALTNDIMNYVIDWVTTQHYDQGTGAGDDAFTIAAVSDFEADVTTTVHMRLQGTGSIDTTAAHWAAGGAVVAVVATFEQRVIIGV